MPKYLSHSRPGHIYDIRRNRSGQIPNAIIKAESWLNEQEDLDLRYELGICYFRIGNLGKAREHFERIFKQEKTHLGAVQGLGQVSLAERDLKEARGHFEYKRYINSNDRNALEGLGQVALAEKNYYEAVQAFRELVAEEPGNLSYRLRLGHAYLRQQEIPQALQVAKHIIQRTTHPVALYFLRAVAAQDKEQKDFYYATLSDAEEALRKPLFKMDTVLYTLPPPKEALSDLERELQETLQWGKTPRLERYNGTPHQSTDPRRIRADNATANRTR